MNVTPLVSLIMSLFSVLLPTKMWFGPNQPVTVKIQTKEQVSLVLTHFDGSVIPPKGSPIAPMADAPVDLKQLYPSVGEVGTYVLFAVPNGKTVADFVGTPIVIETLAEAKGAGPSNAAALIKLEPLRYEKMTTAAGDMTMTFYYDVAPNTIDSFLKLSSEGYYDGLTFHRIVPGFVIQGGDPKGDGTGGPGYTLGAEFNEKKHYEGVLSMARTSDPNTAGSQFFICLDYNNTKQLDNKYTAFGKVTPESMDAVKAIAATPLSDAEHGTPATPQVITKVEVLPVTPGHNPYAAMGLGK